jgi:hypothetical protein
LISNIGAEWRFASAVASRLEQLGALTQGDRRASSGAADMSDFAVDTKWGQKALGNMLMNVQAVMGNRNPPFPGVKSEFMNEDAGAEDEDGNKIPVYTLHDFVEEAVPELQSVGVIGQKFNGTVPTFLNRLFGVRLEIQKKIFRYFLDTFDKTVELAKKNREYSEGKESADSKSVLSFVRLTTVHMPVPLQESSTCQAKV